MQTTGPLYLLCAGSHARVVVAAAESAGIPIAGFFDDQRTGQSVLGYPVLGPLSSFARMGAVDAMVCLGDNRVRLQMQQSRPDVRWATIVHATATVYRTARIGAGSVVMAGAVINPDAVIGAGCIVNTGALVEHDCVLGDGVHLATGVCLGGRVQIGEGALLGTGAIARPDARIGAWSVVGAGAVVIGDVADGVVTYGCPARPAAKKQGP